MKAIILVAGKGSRFGKITKNFPKCLLQVRGKSILDRQLEILRQNGINEIVIVRGYASEKITIPNVKYIMDEEHCYDKVYSLMKAKDELNGDVVIIYGDILFDESILNKMLSQSTDNIQIAVDINWSDYFQKRYGDPLADTVSLIASNDKYIMEIGKYNPAPSFNDIYGQFIGFLRLSDKGCNIFKQTYFSAKNQYWDKEWINGRKFQKVRTTDFLQKIVESGEKVKLVSIERGWLEFDDMNDLKLINEKLNKTEIKKLINLTNI